MVIKFDRDSICMGDDCESHKKKIELSDSAMTSSPLSVLNWDIPSLYNSVWVVESLNSAKRVIGFMLTVENFSQTLER